MSSGQGGIVCIYQSSLVGNASLAALGVHEVRLHVFPCKFPVLDFMFFRVAFCTRRLTEMIAGQRRLTARMRGASRCVS